MMRRVSALVLVAVVALAPVGVHATVLIPADLGELAREAIAIVRGRVVACRATWARDRLDGSAAARLRAARACARRSAAVIVEKPGSVSEKRAHTPGAPLFRKRVATLVIAVLFLVDAHPAFAYLKLGSRINGRQVTL